MKRFNITVNGKAYDVAVEEVTGGAPVATAPAAPVVQTAAPAPAATPAPVAPVVTGGTAVNAPMPGTILDVKVNVGDTVTEGQVLMILEAMKMENDIVAPVAGKVASINVKKGDSVNSNDALASIQ
ncbi:MAG: biotin/lipoyl-binding protein [Oscillospiraceae bacterium]|nr:biotin/lipoyl-binding protein [Oscillospiraceae bacterium]